MSHSASRGAEVVDRGVSDFDAVVSALGFEVRRGRAACIICGAKNHTTCSFDLANGLFHCFRCGVKGGVLDLVEAVFGCDRHKAFRWLAEFEGVPLKGVLSQSQRAQYARTRRAAESAARELAQWRMSVLLTLRQQRNDLYDMESFVSEWARTEIAEPNGAHNEVWEFVWTHALDDRQGAELDSLINEIEQASVVELVALRQRLSEVLNDGQ